MKIALLLPGSGSRFYCENCVRDGSLAAGLIAKGHEVTVCPLYLPLERSDAKNDAESRVFYGAVGIYLRQFIPAFRSAPGWISRIFDSRPALNLAGALSGATNAGGLGGLTVSMLQGPDGNQRADLDELIQWLQHVKPDVVHVSNGLLLGMAAGIREKLGVPIVCSLQDEDSWVDSMAPESADHTWRLMSERAADVDLFLPVSRYYADRMKEKLMISDSKLCVVPIGVDTAKSLQSDIQTDPSTIGFLSHLTESMGLGILVDAFLLLRKIPRHSHLRLALSGGVTGSDHRYVRQLSSKIRRAGAKDDVAVIPLERRREFLSTLTLLSVPVPGGEAFGTFQIEGMASGVPVVQPALGGFPEVVEATGGGVTYMPNTAAALAEAIGRLLDHPEEIRRLGREGRASVMKNFTLAGMIDKIEAAYRRCV